MRNAENWWKLGNTPDIKENLNIAHMERERSGLKKTTLTNVKNFEDSIPWHTEAVQSMWMVEEDFAKSEYICQEWFLI